MNSKKRLAIVFAIAGLACVGIGFLAAPLGLPLSARHQGEFAGFGLPLLLFAAICWFTPGDFHDAAPKPLTRRYYREFFPPMLAYIVATVAMKRLLPLVDATWQRFALVLLPVAFMVLAMRAIGRYIRDSDEMQRRIELESIAFSCGAVSMLYLAGGFLQSEKLIAVSAESAMLLLFPLVSIGYAIAKLFVARRYL